MFQKRTSVARKLILVIASGITVVLVAAAFGLSSFPTDTREKGARRLQANNRMVIDMIDTYNRSLEQTVVAWVAFCRQLWAIFPRCKRGCLHHGSETISMENTAFPTASPRRPRWRRRC